MLPDAGAGIMPSPLTAHWIMIVPILWIATVAAGVAGGMIWRWISGPEERDDKTTER